MYDFLSELFIDLCQFACHITDSDSYRFQGALVLAICAIVSLVGGFCSSGIAAIVFFFIAGLTLIGAVVVGTGVLGRG